MTQKNFNKKIIINQKQSKNLSHIQITMKKKT